MTEIPPFRKELFTRKFTLIEPRCDKNPSSGFPTRFDTNRAVQPQKKARGLEFRLWKVEGLYYPSSENKGADQLRSYCAADLRLCFRICKKAGFLITRLNLQL